MCGAHVLASVFRNSLGAQSLLGINGVGINVKFIMSINIYLLPINILNQVFICIPEWEEVGDS